MNKPMLIVLLSLAAAGCATSSMKSTPFYTGSERVYTGRVEDRVNLWPFAYYREPALSVLWPLFSQTDDHLAVRPIYSQYRQGGKDSGYDEFNFLWPLCQFDTKHDEHRIFPLFWGDDYFDVFPLVWNHRDSHCLFPLVWWREDEYLDVFPLFWKSKSMLALLPLFYTDQSETYVFPSFYRNKDVVAFFPFYERDTSGGELTEWFGPAGHHRGKESSHWFLPFYYCGESSLWTPLYGHTAESNWLFPLWYKDERKFISPFWGWSRSGHFDNYVVPPLLSWMESSERGEKKMRFLLGLGGVNTKKDGDVDCSWVIPLYYNDERSFISLPFAHVKDDYTWVTPLFGVTHQGYKKGAWLWPFYGWTNDAHMEAAEAQMNADRLDPKLRVEKREWVSAEKRTNWWYNVTAGPAPAHNCSWRLSGLSTSDRWIGWSASDDGETVSGEETSYFGNILAYQSDYNRTVKFDYATKRKLSDEEESESGLLCRFLWHSKHEEGDGHEYDMKSILWRFWHYEKLNGDVTVDSFPFFAYDSKTNGYSKTSLCWRLFRNEYDPKEGKRKVDVLFVPVWR